MGSWDKGQNLSVCYLFLYISPMYLPATDTAMHEIGVSSGKYQVPSVYVMKEYTGTSSMTLKVLD